MDVLTHVHPDHQGATHELCERLGMPLWCGEDDADAAERPKLIRERQPVRNRESIRRIAALEPRVACFGHGPIWTDTAKLTAFAASLP